MDGLT